MGRKSTAKERQRSAGAQPLPSGREGDARSAGGGLNPLVVGAVLVALVGVGLLAFWDRGAPTAPDAPAASNPSQPPATPQADAAAIAKAEAAARFGPRKPASYPPIPFHNAAPPRPPEVVTEAYHFAAEHPEILSYVPCFCGCERSGHGGNHDCFVRKRDEAGEVVEWDEHGVECTVCIDVANRSRQMHASGASVRDIRAAIDKEFGAIYPAGRNMATPHPPGAH
jgi:hypothetical protein